MPSLCHVLALGKHYARRMDPAQGKQCLNMPKPVQFAAYDLLPERQ
tara:strand:+ start:3863 stop:4000 length:138 start_codon:yes stop_codon:yes gene_type:complete